MNRTRLLIPLAALASAWTMNAQSPAEIIWTKTISTPSDRYCGWPSVCDVGGGELVTVFSGDRSAHVCPWGKVLLKRSKDGGETWSASETVCNSVLDDRDAGLLRLKSGDLVLFWFTSAHFYERKNARKNHPDEVRHFEKLDMASVRRDLGSFSRRSADGGRTWEAPVRLPTSAPHGGIQLSDGRLLVVGNQYPLVRGNLESDPAEKALAGAKPRLVIAESLDEGRSWRELAQIQIPSGRAYEPHVIEGADGAIRCYVRTRRDLLHAESRDGGRSWSALRETAIPSWDNPPHLLRLKDGRTLLTYGRRVRDAKDHPERKTGIFARIGDANATPESFASSEEITIRVFGNTDMGYPSSVECSDGTLLTVFYGCENPTASIIAVKWRPSK